MDMSNVLTETGLNLPDKYTDEQFREAGVFLGRIEHGMQWAIGDWYNSIKCSDEGDKKKTSKEKEDACNEVGLNYNTARACGAVANIFPFDLRRSKVAFNSHKSLINKKLSEKNRLELLEKADILNWKITILTAEINKAIGKVEKAPIEGFSERVEVAVEKIQESMPKTATKKLGNIVKKEVSSIAEELKKEFQVAVQKEVTSRIDEQRKALREAKLKAQKEYDRSIKMQSSINSFMSREDFRFIRSLLHPDKHNGDARYARAFDIFNKLEAGIPKLSKQARESQGWE